ncbi:MAG: phenylalanine--tRNA ligase subunit beta [Candidatus Zixiibacteriota bacterium]
MQLSYLWLKELTGLNWSAPEMAERLTLSGCACESIEPAGAYLKNVIVGQVTALESVPGASKIQKATVDTGRERLQVICGAPNVAVGQKVPLAHVGARLAGDMEIKKVTIRGVESSGMICSEKELGLSADHSGIMVLDNDAPVGKPLIEHLDLDDYIMGFEVTPNRGDLLSAIGIARDLAALGGVSLKLPTIALRESKTGTNEFVSVKIEDPKGCPRYAARIIRNVRIGPSPWWLKKKLMLAGIRPINNVVDITNLVMLESGNPLHAFDLELFGSNTVVVRRAREGEKFVTLDEQPHTLSSHVLLITNGVEGVAAAGVMGGLRSGVQDTTSTILLEAAYFDPVVIRKGRRELGLNTESSYRFERGVDPNGIPYAMDRAAFLFQELCGGEVLTGMVDSYPEPRRPKCIGLRPERCRASLGTDISTDKIAGILNALGLPVAEGNQLQVTIPTFRSDIANEIDLIEEVARIIGWANIPDAVSTNGPLYTPIHERDRFETDLRHILTAAGFDEILGHGLADSRIAEQLYPELPKVRLVNPVSDELDIMRNTLVQTALTAASHNIAHRLTDIRLFEIGAVYWPPNDKGEWVEEDRLSLLATGNIPGNWKVKSRPAEFADLQGAIASIGRHYGWPEMTFALTAVPFLESSASFKASLGSTTIGSLGFISAETLKRFDIKQTVYYAEFNLAAMMDLSHERRQFVPLPAYPSAPRDLAVIVDEQVPVGQILNLVRTMAGEIAESVDMFDLYTGQQIGAGKKSVGIAITYRSRERSLAGDEVDVVQQKIVAELKKKFNAEIRER